MKDNIAEFLGVNKMPDTFYLELEEDIKDIKTSIDPGGRGEFNAFYGKNHTSESLEKISAHSIGNKNRLGKSHTNETKKKISEGTIERFKDIKNRKVISEKLKNRKLNAETKRKMSEIRKNVPKSEEHKAKISESNKNVQKFLCVNCGDEFTRSHLTRWHGDNCKKVKNV